jgi:hypothetical protein
VTPNTRIVISCFPCRRPFRLFHIRWRVDVEEGIDGASFIASGPQYDGCRQTSPRPARAAQPVAVACGNAGERVVCIAD